MGSDGQRTVAARPQESASGDMSTIRFGDDEVPVLERTWPCAPRSPYRKTYRLRPGDLWSNAPATEEQFEYYVETDGLVMPVGAAIARELITEGAAWACFTELWAGRVVVVGPDLICQAMEGPVAALIGSLQAANGGVLGGLPDVIGERPDGTVLLREAKTPQSKDRLNVNQHNFARSARQLLGHGLDLAVVSWIPASRGALRN